VDWATTNLSQAGPRDTNVQNSYVAWFLMAYVLQKAGSNLTRESLLSIATHLDHLAVPVLCRCSAIMRNRMHRARIRRFFGGTLTPERGAVNPSLCIYA
jgi:hypothetical protein